ncbi:hypothetical protein K0038_03558 [Pseudomonas syringae]|uniref:dermonecrotic toxin domain-containing protein n=1 Tax=Pseudomonas syringae TaxID=317 RepID=UPI001CA91EF3|nr:DUF6543 domain-containing protein [Pseudomonas syringae]MCI3946499.1 hypothetical protein [Pseudomonas syringae]
MSDTPPYFFSESLRAQFAQDIRHAAAQARISSRESLWLQTLVLDNHEAGHEAPAPRVDRLVIDDGSAAHPELAGALLISDPDGHQTPVFLSTLLSGLERFEHRTALLDALRRRFDEFGDLVAVEAERVENSLFETRTLAVIRQQARYLGDLAVQLDSLPDLRTAAGKALQVGLLERDPTNDVDVFTHLAQIVDTMPASDNGLTSVVGTQTLVEAAVDEVAAQSLPSGLARVFLDAQGHVLAGAERDVYSEALAATASAVPTVYEQLLADYWTAPRLAGRTGREVAVLALAESFRRHLLAGRAAGALNDADYHRLRVLLPAHDAALDPQSIRVCRLSVSVAGQEPVKLVGRFLIDFPGSGTAGVYLYSSLAGFKHFDNMARMTTHLVGDPARARLLASASLNDHPALCAQGHVELQFEPVTTAFFSEFVEGVIALQKRNLRHVLGLPPIAFEKIPARIDDALDIRALLDGRLLNLPASARWRSDLLPFDQVWGSSASATSEPHAHFETADNWVGKLRKVERLLERVDSLHHGVEGCMRDALNRYLALLDLPSLDARTLWVSAGTGDGPPEYLLSLALERACGHPRVAHSNGAVLEGLVAPRLVRSLPLALLEHMLDCVLADFPRRFEQQVVELYSRSIRHLDSQVQPGVLSALVREYALRLELFIEKRTATLPESVLRNVQQVLDRPLAVLRAALGDERVDAFTLSFQYDPLAPAVALPNAFVISNRLRPEKPALWLIGKGLLVFETRHALTQYVASRLAGAESTVSITNLLAEPDRQTLLSRLAQPEPPDINVTLHLVEGHFIAALQGDEIERQRRTAAYLYRQAAEWELPSGLFSHLLEAAERDDRNRQVLSNLGSAIQFVIYRAIVPVWIIQASMNEQIILVEALRRFYVNCVGLRDFLFDVPDLYQYSQEQLTKSLARDFPDQSLDPEDILVTLTHYVAVPVPAGQTPQSIPAATGVIRESLVEFAANRFMSRLDGAISITLKEGRTTPAALTPAYVRHLVESLDIATGYRSVLDRLFADTDPDYAERRSLFTQQMPSLDLLRAFSMKLKNDISGDAYRFVEGVLNMPDAIARLPVDGKYVQFCRLQLLPASEGWAPTIVLNAYLIGPSKPQSGPWVLYVLTYDDFVFKEYPSQAAVLEDIRTSRSLKQFILDHIDPGMRKVYDNGGFMEPHLPFSVESDFDVPWRSSQPVTLKIEPYEGNALQLMFEDALDILKLQVQQQSVTNAEHRRNRLQYLFTLGAEQVMALMPGRLGALIGIWQSQTLFNSSVVSAGRRRWGKAFSEFMAAVSVMISSRQNPQSGEEVGPQWEGDESQEVSELPEDAADVPVFSWGNSSLTQQMRARLLEFEVHDVALNTLQKDELLNTFKNPVTGGVYAAVDGKAYQLQRDRDGWFIVAGDKTGPSVKLDINQRWTLDIQGGLRGGGGIVTRMESSLIDEEVEEIIVISASGMPAIRQAHHEMALSIEEGHAQAQRYLENCLANLKPRPPDEKVDVRTEKILADFFDHKTPDAPLHSAVKKAVTGVYQALMDPSLSPIDSPRYVIGVNRIGNEASSAFVFEADPSKRIFLTEQFFRLPSYRFKVSAMRSGDFRYGPHYRAAILIHELSHLVLRTDDIAYVDSQAPYADLLEDAPSYRLRIRNEQIVAQQKTLSFQTDRSVLFKQMEDGVMRDLRRIDGNGKATILRLSGKSTLDEARNVFYADVHKRADIMLKNADTVALLVTLLGRERFVKR